MTKQDGVYYIPVEINGVRMEFVFDTGASDITISDTEAIFLYKQGKLTQEDIIGKQEYMIADGTISEGTVIVLRTVKIGNKMLENVKASIVHNSKAPLLLGQSALSMFGKISIDYNRLELRFE
jgi:aspartyl protease family protein